jgi:ornithine decarboxylase
LNSILFLMTPAVGEGKMAMLLAALERFRDWYQADAPLDRVLPRLYARLHGRYGGYSLRRVSYEVQGVYQETGEGRVRSTPTS